MAPRNNKTSPKRKETNIFSTHSNLPAEKIVRRKPNNVTPTKKEKKIVHAELTQVVKVLKWHNNSKNNVSNGLCQTQHGTTVATTIWWNTSAQIKTFVQRKDLINKIVQIDVKKTQPSTAYDACDETHTLVLGNIQDVQLISMYAFEPLRVIDSSHDKLATFVEFEENQHQKALSTKIVTSFFLDEYNQMIQVTFYDLDGDQVRVWKKHQQILMKHLQEAGNDAYSFKFSRMSYCVQTGLESMVEEDVYDINKVSAQDFPLNSCFFHVKDVGIDFDIDDVSKDTKFFLTGTNYVRFRVNVLENILQMTLAQFEKCNEPERLEIVNNVSGYFDLRVKLFKNEYFVWSCRRVEYDN